MLQEQRLCAPAFSYLHFGISFEWPDGWAVKMSGRREGAEAYEHEHYDRLDVFELHDVVATVLALKLGI